MFHFPGLILRYRFDRPLSEPNMIFRFRGVLFHYLSLMFCSRFGVDVHSVLIDFEV